MVEKKPFGGAQGKPVKGLMIQMNFNIQNVLWFLVIGAMIFSLFQLWQSGNKIVKEVQLSQALSDIKDQKIEKVEVFADRLALYYKDKKGEVYFSRKEPFESLTQILEWAKIDPSTVKYEIKDQTMSQIIAEVVPSLLGTGLVVLILLYMMRQARGAQDSLFSFGNSKAKLFAKGKLDVKFADVPESMKPKENWKKWWIFSKTLPNTKRLGLVPPKVYCWLDQVELGRHFWQRLSPVKPMCLSSPWPDLNLWKCWWE